VRKTIYLIRHGETDYNKMGIVQGSGINSSLNDKGIRQARAFYDSYKNISFDNIYTSDLNRTKESVYPFIENGHKAVSLIELNEINWGEIEGKRPDSIIRKKFKDTMRLWSEGIYDVSVEGGETPLEMQERQRHGLSKIIGKAKEEKILIASHGRAMRSLLCTMLDEPLRNMDLYPHSNLCLYVLEFKNDKFSLKVRNCTNHLQE
jgi:probable phosphoglycerate mutase